MWHPCEEKSPVRESGKAGGMRWVDADGVRAVHGPDRSAGHGSVEGSFRCGANRGPEPAPYRAPNRVRRQDLVRLVRRCIAARATCCIGGSSAGRWWAAAQACRIAVASPTIGARRAGGEGERRRLPVADEQAGGGGVGVEVGQVVLVEFGQGVPGRIRGRLRASRRSRSCCGRSRTPRRGGRGGTGPGSGATGPSTAGICGPRRACVQRCGAG